MATPATSITTAEFKDALSRYPKVLADYSKPPKEGSLSLEELDKFRYETAPSNFSKSTGRVMKLTDVQKLLDWKMKHGTFRPTLGKLVASNSDEKVAAATKDAFAHYETHATDIKGVLEKLATPLKGVGPATGSLLLAIHDPANVIYFSDELYRWLLHSGKKVSAKYSASEFDDLYSQAKTFMARVKCTPIELEKVAFVVIKESEPTYEPTPKYVPSGKPRGRPAKPDSEKKVKVPSGKPRGRPARVAEKAIDTPTSDAAAAKSEAASKTAKVKAETAEPKKRGRPAKVVEDTEPATPATRKSGRASATASPATTTPASKKRGRPASASAKSSNKKIKT